MNKWEFGFTMLVAGAGGTLLSLYALSIMVNVLKKIFPRVAETNPAGRSGSER